MLVYWHNLFICVIVTTYITMKDNQKKPHEDQEQSKKKKTSSAASIDGIIGSPTENVRSRRSSADWSNTGTNISYEGNTAPAGGGSVGTGQSSGKEAVDPRINANDAYDNVRNPIERDESSTDGEQLMKPDRKNDQLDRDTLGTP